VRDEMTLTNPSLLGATVAMGRIRPSLLSYHCSDALVATGPLSVPTVAYGILLQCLLVVVFLLFWAMVLLATLAAM
jgi:hypothetical protein